jgi:hypothetical protein
MQMKRTFLRDNDFIESGRTQEGMPAKRQTGLFALRWRKAHAAVAELKSQEGFSAAMRLPVMRDMRLSGKIK